MWRTKIWAVPASMRPSWWRLSAKIELGGVILTFTSPIRGTFFLRWFCRICYSWICQLGTDVLNPGGGWCHLPLWRLSCRNHCIRPFSVWLTGLPLMSFYEDPISWPKLVWWGWQRCLINGPEARPCVLMHESHSLKGNSQVNIIKLSKMLRF